MTSTHARSAGGLIDRRLRSSVGASVGWYEDICASHGIATVLRDGLWSAGGPPPPLHSGVVTHLFPDRPLVGDERGDDLVAAIAGGFGVVGELRVWVP